MTTSEGTRTVTVDQPTFSDWPPERCTSVLSGGDVSRWHADIVDDGGRYASRTSDLDTARSSTAVRSWNTRSRTGITSALGRSGAVELVFETGDGTISTVKESTSDVT